MRGGEKVIESLCLMFPEADVFTHVYDPDAISSTIKAHCAYLRPALTRPGRASREQPHELACAQGVEMSRQVESEWATVPSAGGSGSSVCRMYGAGRRSDNSNALKHGASNWQCNCMSCAHPHQPCAGALVHASGA